MAQHNIVWQHFPKDSPCPISLQQITHCFESVITEISSKKNVGQNSNAVLAKVRDGLVSLGFTVESSKSAEGKIKVPVLYGANGKIDKSFDADAYHPGNKIVLEVEAGRAVSNYQFLKDLFQACVMQDVDYLAIAVRQDYRGSNDFEKVAMFLETIFASSRLTLPLTGILIIGY
jgi:hypothetical protein